MPGMAKKNPEKRVVFFGLGFETTMPSTALSVMQAEKEGIDNFYLFIFQLFKYHPY
jgi:hydrogenase expression/formation protein HypD